MVILQFAVQSGHIWDYFLFEDLTPPPKNVWPLPPPP